MAPKLISVIGSMGHDMFMVTDRVPDGGESHPSLSYSESLGGKGANAAIATYRSCHSKIKTNGNGASQKNGNSQNDIQVMMVGAVGDDKWGDEFRTELKANNIDITGISTVSNERTCHTFVIVENDTKENRCLFFPGATASWKPEDFRSLESLANGKRPDLLILQMEMDSVVVEAIIMTAGENGVEVVLNAAPGKTITKPTWKHVTHLLVNETEAAIMAGLEKDQVNETTWSKIADIFLRRGVKNVVITLGAQGAYYATKSRRARCPARSVMVEDSTGAGDTFSGTYASEYIRQIQAGEEWDIHKAVTRANTASALTIQMMGCQEGIPWAEEIDNFVE